MFKKIMVIGAVRLTALLLMFTSTVFSQNITNTLGTSGVFTIKDASNNFLTLNQSTGQINILRSLHLERTTSSTLGIIFKDGYRFMHDYGDNTFLGINSGNFTMENGARGNTGVGLLALSSLTDGFENTALGTSSLESNSGGYSNTSVGAYSLGLNTNGNYNTSVGFQSMFSNTTGANNTALGHGTLGYNTTGIQNTAVGGHSLLFNISGDSNTAIGFESLYSNTNGSYNTALGNTSLNKNTTGSGNTALGKNSLVSNTTGSLNTGLGYLSLSSNTNGTLNTALGYSTGSTITSGFNLTLVGYNAEPTNGSASNQITLGNTAVTSLRCNVQTITSLSDARDKKNIKDLSLGLDFLMKVKPRLFNWDKREWYENNTSDGSKMNEAPTAGFIAQELDEVQTTENAEWLNLVLKDNPEKFEATYGNLLPVMVKAIQELSVESEKLKVKSEKLEVENEKLKVENIELNNHKKDTQQRLIKLEQTQNKLVSEIEKFKSNESKVTEVRKGEEK